MEKTNSYPVTATALTPQGIPSPLAEVEAKVIELLTTVTELKYVDQDWGQLDEYSQNPPVKWPCALVDVSSANYSNIGTDRGMVPKNRQMAECTLEVTVANLKLSSSSGRAPQGQRTHAANIKEIIEKVHQALHGVSTSPKAGALIRQRYIRQRRDDGIQQYSIIYIFGMHNV